MRKTTLTLSGTLLGALLLATALTPLAAADSETPGGEPDLAPLRVRAGSSRRADRARCRAGQGAGSTRLAHNSALSISPVNRAWASRACCTSFANVSIRSVPLSYQETVHPMVSRHRFSHSSK